MNRSFLFLLASCLVAASWLQQTNAFAPLPACSSSFTRPTTTTTTSLSLLPSQGNQLAAAWTAACSSDDVDTDDLEATMAVKECGVSPDTTETKSAARKFVSKVFSLPSSMIKRHPHPTVEGFDESSSLWDAAVEDSSSSDDDVVLFPVVGFTYVKDAPHHVRALPTISTPSCRLPAQGEYVVGWFSRACKLEP